MYDTSDFRKGLKVLIDGQPYIIVDFQFVKPGKGVAFTRARVKNMLTGSVLDKTYRSGEKLEPANIDERQMQFLYKEGENYCFMDQQNYDQVFVPGEVVGDSAKYLSDNLEVSVIFFADRPVDLTLPNFVTLEVVETDPGFRGDTATGATKQARLSAGAVINVPLFIEKGEWLKIDTRTGSYVERVKR
ncbi:MAG: elongation factor P [Proteobacteria bacterium]|nr:elongation factor P [Pseudomonadota bacterium]